MSFDKSSLYFVNNKIKCSVCNKIINQYLPQTSDLIKGEYEDFKYTICHCEYCNAYFWVTLNLKYQEVAGIMQLPIDDINCAEWEVLDDTWFCCSNCRHIHSRPFLKYKYCPNCGSYMNNSDM